MAGASRRASTADRLYRQIIDYYGRCSVIANVTAPVWGQSWHVAAMLDSSSRIAGNPGGWLWGLCNPYRPHDSYIAQSQLEFDQSKAKLQELRAAAAPHLLDARRIRTKHQLCMKGPDSNRRRTGRSVHLATLSAEIRLEVPFEGVYDRPSLGGI
ncbi:uncharacterized protein M421DRAFT_398184 [Didymella exigua CBS 183.55]|uniref:Uncharacterized protein n=1 Tax=Didymella exigua CBS 183.55 TaxID=1150837 RepID=A0A6A5REW6_9PLEO|nr:uncharacterized protein M421DRAFT_398184 [Didymella exigua CBS 183.55]KAF1925644.1 hypothetical protein M421DRAFT_398184 [Didymella exigua CBS 183.55]